LIEPLLRSKFWVLYKKNPKAGVIPNWIPFYLLAYSPKLILFIYLFLAISIVLSIKCDHLYQLGLQVAMHHQWQFSFLWCSCMIINHSSLFMSMSNFILININIMDMQRHMLIWFFISMLVGKENGKIIIKIKNNYLKRNEVVFQQLFFHVSSFPWSIKLISLALFILFPSLLIIFFNWLMWVCLFNFINVQLGLHLAYFLCLSPCRVLLPLNCIKILSIPFDFASLASSFLQEALCEDIWHANMLLRLAIV